MRFKLSICILLSTVLVMNPLTNKHINATLPNGKIEISDSAYIEDSESEDISSADSYSTDHEESDTDKIPNSDSESINEEDYDPNERLHSESDDFKFRPIPEDTDEYEICIIGRYLHTKGKKDRYTESHHIISSSLCTKFGLRANDAPTICLPHRLHIRTGSYGSTKEAREYRKQELQTLYAAIRQNSDRPSADEATLKKIFISMNANQKYACLQAVLKMGLDDLADKCSIYLQTRADCMAKLDAELRRLAGKNVTQNPNFTKCREEPANCFYRRRTSYSKSDATEITSDSDTTVTTIDAMQKREFDETDFTPTYTPLCKRSRVEILLANPHTPLRASIRQHQKPISEQALSDELGNIEDLFPNSPNSDSKSKDDNFLKLP